MKSHGLLMTPDLIRATLAGIKTETRRIPTPRNCTFDGGTWPKELVKDGAWKTALDWDEHHIRITSEYLLVYHLETKQWHSISPRIQQGDTIYIKEAWCTFGDSEFCYKVDSGHVFTKDGDGFHEKKWKSPMFMPREAARIVRPVLSVGFEFLQDITFDAAFAEGMLPKWSKVRSGYSKGNPAPSTAAFITLWDSINADRGYPWASNPPVLVIKFGKENIV